MKFTKLLVLSVLGLFSLGASAADLVERTVVAQPTTLPVFGSAGIAVDLIDRTPQTFEVGKLYVLYNVTADKFFYQGCNWATQAAVDDTPLAVRFTLPEGKTLADAQLLLNDYNIFTNKWNEAFFDSPTGIFTDRGSQANMYWQVVDMGNKTYRLQASEANPDYKPSTNAGFVGRDDAVTDAGDPHGRTVSETAMPISPFLDEAEGHHINWQFFSVPDELNSWNAYFTYLKSQDLKAAIEKAEGAGVDVSAAVAVYNDMASTEDQMDAQIIALKEAMKNNIGNATGENPQDASSWIKNATFDTVGNFDGWSGTKFGAGGTTAPGAEHYNKTYDTYQDVTILHPGLYLAGVKGYYRAGSISDAYTHFMADDEASKYSKFYATVGETTKETPVNSIYKGTSTVKPAHGAGTQGGGNYWIPNTMADADKYIHQDGLYGNLVYIEVPEANTTMRIGVKKSGQLDTDWSYFDDFSLTYFGNKDDAYQGLLNELIKVNYPDFVLGDEDLYTYAYMEVYENARVERTATNAEEMEAVLAEIDAAYQVVKKNLNLWAQYKAKMAELKSYTVKQEYATQAENEETTEFANAFFDLQDYEEEEYPAIVEAMELTNEALEAEIQKVADMITRFTEAVKNDLKKGDDVTRFLVNADFEQGGTGWLGGSSITAFNKGCAEAYEKNPFDLYQIVKGMKPGVYSISLQGFYRLGANDAAYTSWKNAKKSGNPEPPVAWVYLNENRTALNNVFDIEGQISSNDFFVTPLDGTPAAYSGTDDDGNVWYFPNGMSTSHDCFEADMYTKAAYGLIRAGEDLRIGIKGALGTQQWAIWDNFKLTFEGNDFNTIKPLLEDAIAAVDTQVKTIDDAAAEGEQTLGKDVRDQIAAVKTAAATAIANNDGDAAFDALSDALALQESITASAALFVQLIDELGQIETALIDALNETYKAETNIWYSDILDKIATGGLTDAEAKEILEQVAERKAKLAQPDPALASDTDAKDVTPVIVNPGNDTNTGWAGTAAAYNESCAEIFNANFDFYQDLNYLNEGTYEVRVQGFYRAGSAVNDYKTFTDSVGHMNYAVVYAMASDSIVRSIPLKRLASGAVEGDSLSLPDGYTFGLVPVDSIGLMGQYVANTMTTAQTEFSNGNYKNEGLFVKVAEDGKLRIGIKKEVQVDQNWTIWDSWQLIYYGKDSQKALSGDASASIDNAVGEMQTVKVEYFTLDGRKALRAQKGILIQKMTLSNGTVVVKKVRK